MTDDKLRGLLLDHANYVRMDYQIGAENSPATEGTADAILALFAAERKKVKALVEAGETAHALMGEYDSFGTTLPQTKEQRELRAALDAVKEATE